MNPTRILTGLGTAILLAVILVTTGGQQLDWSTGRTHTLAQPTVDFLHQIDRPIHLEIFYAADQPGRADVIDLATRFADHTARLTISIEDPDGPRAIELRVASGSVAATRSDSATPSVVRNPDEADLVTTIAKAIGLADPAITPHRPPSQPLFPTPLGRTLLWLIPTIALPTALALAGLTIIWTRRRS